MTINSSLFTSNKQNWETPKNLFEQLNKEHKFDLDGMASDENKKCINYFTEEDDFLKQDLSNFKSIFVNPPYENKLQTKVLKKCYEENKKNGTKIVLLIPARTDTKRWHDYIFGKAEVIFLKGRLKFESGGVPHKNSAPFPSALIIYK